MQVLSNEIFAKETENNTKANGNLFKVGKITETSKTTIYLQCTYFLATKYQISNLKLSESEIN